MNDKYIKNALKIATEFALEVFNVPSVRTRRGCRVDGNKVWYNNEFFAFAIPDDITVSCKYFSPRCVNLNGFEQAKTTLTMTNTTIKDGKRTLHVMTAEGGTRAYVDAKFLKLFLYDQNFEYRTAFYKGKPGAIGVFDSDRLIGIVMPAVYREGEPNA